mmetsp:Transcript_40562/g.95547  ORF Transcript_40562/g.95547 Transcript_40562/m.95547 type:complete len:200 (+) Transcript_40562:186-785(+)
MWSDGVWWRDGTSPPDEEDRVLMPEEMVTPDVTLLEDFSGFGSVPPEPPESPFLSSKAADSAFSLSNADTFFSFSKLIEAAFSFSNSAECAFSLSNTERGFSLSEEECDLSLSNTAECDFFFVAEEAETFLLVANDATGRIAWGPDEGGCGGVTPLLPPDVGACAGGCGGRGARQSWRSVAAEIVADPRRRLALMSSKS